MFIDLPNGAVIRADAITAIVPVGSVGPDGYGYKPPAVIVEYGGSQSRCECGSMEERDALLIRLRMSIVATLKG